MKSINALLKNVKSTRKVRGALWFWGGRLTIKNEASLSKAFYTSRTWWGSWKTHSKFHQEANAHMGPWVECFPSKKEGGPFPQESRGHHKTTAGQWWRHKNTTGCWGWCSLWSACWGSSRTRVQISRAHTGLGMGASICCPGALMRRWKSAMGEFLGGQEPVYSIVSKRVGILS